MQQKVLRTLVVLILFGTTPCLGKGKLAKWFRLKPDSTYVQSNLTDLIVRVYASQKYAAQSILDLREKISLDYKPSNGYVVGLGFNYKFLGINIGTIFPFSQPDINRFGKTKYLDFQSHLYLRVLTVDFYTGYYKGNYLNNSEQVLNPLSDSGFYPRGDISTYSCGLGIYANLNPTKYSIRAPFLQNEWQKKSAGQPMLGVEFYGVGSSADSSFIPSQMVNKNFFDRINFNKWSFFSMNLTGGYAYTLVIQKKFFLMAGVNFGLGIGDYQLSRISGEKLNRISPNLSINQKLGVGYHFDKLFIGMSFANFQYFTPTPVKHTAIRWQTGNLRFNIAYRINIKKDIEIRPWKWLGSKKELI